MGNEGRLYLGRDGLVVIAVDGKKTVGSGRGDDLDLALLIIIIEGAEHVPLIVFAEIFFIMEVEILIKPYKGLEDGIGTHALEFPASEGYLAVEIGEVALGEEAIPQHGAEGRGKTERELEGDFLGFEAPKKAQKGQIGLGKSFEEPPLF